MWATGLPPVGSAPPAYRGIVPKLRSQPRIDHFSVGSVRIDGRAYTHDVVIDHGRVTRRDKAASKPHRERLGHTPLSVEEPIPWGCRRLIVGTGAMGALPVLDEVRAEAGARRVELITVPTKEAIRLLAGAGPETNAILHLTC